jgi:glycosyltransferase involved in cell wall biosynthesis
VTSAHCTIAVVVATRGRAQEVKVLLERLAHGSRKPERIVIVGSSPDDWGGAIALPLNPETIVAQEPGLPRQRNVGVRHVLSGASEAPDVIAFFDDDFRPETHWLEEAAAVFAVQSTVEGLTGVVLRDGARGAAISEDEAVTAIAEWMRPVSGSTARVPRLYGCNMAVRTSVFGRANFDERLPLYGWLEDLDFSGQVADPRSGKLVTAQGCVGVHLGSKGARVSGRRYGYSQIINPLYLAGKGTCPRGLAAVLVARALTSNSLRSIKGHPLFDYRGRLAGNVRAIFELLRGSAKPERIVDL